MSEENRYAIESYGTGFIVADYSGERGRHGAAMAGLDGVWKSQPIGLTPFPTREAAEQFIADAMLAESKK